MKRELKLSDSGLLTLLIKVAEREKAKIILPFLSDNFWLRTSVRQKVFLFTFVTPDKSKSPAARADSLMKIDPSTANAVPLLSAGADIFSLQSNYCVKR